MKTRLVDSVTCNIVPATCLPTLACLTQQEAPKRTGITQPKVSDMVRGDFTNLSERKLMDCLTRLGYDLEISVRPAQSEVGHLMLAAV